MFYHHNTIQTYVGALLNLFNDLEVQYKNSKGNIVSRNIPVRFSTREKSKILDEYTPEQLTSGNTNILPRANILWSAVVKADQRTTNKNVKINTKANENNFEFLYNSVPYEFMFELSVMCRGMNEATMIIEQIASKFNPNVNIDVYDATNLTIPTRIPVTLLDIGLNTEDYEDTSSNIITISFGLSVKGNMYPPIKSIERIKEFKMTISETKDNIKKKPHDINQRKVKKSILEGNVIEMELQELNLIIPENEDTSPKVIEIIEIVGNNVLVGENELLCIWNDIDSTIRELNFEWYILSGDASIEGNKDKARLFVNEPGDIEVLVKVTDEEGNYSSMSRVFVVN